MSKARTDTPNDKDREDLEQAKATILLQQKQIYSYEKLIRKQNDKIQSLRQFIVKHHGKDTLKTMESCTTTTSTIPAPSITCTKKPARIYSSITGTRITPNHNNVNATERKHLDNDQSNNNSNRKKRNLDIDSSSSNNDSKRSNRDNMINIRLGLDDMRSFFFSQPDTARPLVKSEPQSPSQWETITSSLSKDHRPPSSDTSSSPSSQTTHDSPIPSPPNKIPTKTSITVSPFSDEYHIPPRAASNIKRKLASPMNTPSNRHRLSKDIMWETLCSPSPPELDILRPASVANPSSSRPMQPNASTRFVPNQRHILTPICQNQSAEEQNNKTTLNQIITRPTTDTEFPYEEVVRKKDERANLHGVTCTCCAKYFDSDNPSSTTTHEHIQRYSRHRERYSRPKTPPGYWDLDFPDSPQK